MMTRILHTQLAVIVIYMTAWYLVARALSRFDVADIAWGPGFMVAALTAAVVHGELTVRAYLVMALVAVWGIRLCLHVFVRNRGKPEDARYRAWRLEWAKYATIRAFFQVFLLQGLLLLVISLPVTSVIMGDGTPYSVFDAAGLAVWTTGMSIDHPGSFWEKRKALIEQGRIAHAQFLTPCKKAFPVIGFLPAGWTSLSTNRP